jgi:hypothetical protein
MGRLVMGTVILTSKRHFYSDRICSTQWHKHGRGLDSFPYDREIAIEETLRDVSNYGTRSMGVRFLVS